MQRITTLLIFILFFLTGCAGVGVARLVNLEKEDELAKLTYEQINEINFGHTPLTQLLAFGDGSTRKLEMLLRNKADPNVFEVSSPLKIAAMQNRYEFVKLLLEYGADPNAVDYFGGTALHSALEHDNNQMVRLLLENGAKTGFLTKKRPQPNQNGLSELTIAAVRKNKEAIVLLLENGADPNQYNEQNFYPLVEAVIGQEPETAELLLKAGANVNVDMPNNYSLLHIAIDKGYNNLVKLLLEHGAKTGLLTKDYSENKFNGISELSRAVIKKNSEVVRLLLAVGADPNLFNTQRVYPLTEAVYSQNYAITQLLVDAGAEVDVVSGAGYSALHLAAINKNYSLAALLLEKGANPNSKTDHGISPLHEAAFAGDLKTVELLVTNGAATDMTDKLGRSAIQFADFQGHGNVVDLLVKNGADPNFQPLVIPTQQPQQTAVANNSSGNSNLWTAALVGVMNAVGSYYGAKNGYQHVPLAYSPPASQPKQNTHTNERNQFCAGFNEGYRSIKGSLVVAPVCPVMLVVPVGSTAFREGLLVGQREAMR